MKAAAPMPVCPFCGVITQMPHENQQVCLEALTAEITRLRNVLEHSESTAVPTPAPPGDDDGTEEP